MKRLPLLLIPLLLLAACSRTPGSVLGQEDMARLLVDLELADAYATEQRLGDFGSDSMRLALRESVLAKHRVNEATLDTSLRWYGRNLPRLLEVYDRMDSILADSLRALDLELQLAQTTAAGDSVSLWALAPSIVMQGSDYLVFELEADSTWERGDVIEWDFATHNMKREPVTVTLAAEYADRAATIDAQTLSRETRDNNRFSLLLQLDKQKSLKRLFGYVNIPLDSGRRVFVDSITLTRTRMVDNEYHIRRYRMRHLTRHKGL